MEQADYQATQAVGPAGRFGKWLAKLEWRRNDWLGVKYHGLLVESPYRGRSSIASL